LRQEDDIKGLGAIQLHEVDHSCLDPEQVSFIDDVIVYVNAKVIVPETLKAIA
jgi:hypothetical protein